MNYAVRNVVREIEWQSRAALSVADDLQDALCDGERFKAAAAVRALVVRVQKVTELLWPGRDRLGDRLLPDRASSVRALLQVEATTPLTPDRIGFLYALFDRDLDEEQPGRTDFRKAPVLLSGGERYDLGEVLREVERLWGRACDALELG